MFSEEASLRSSIALAAVFVLIGCGNSGTAEGPSDKGDGGAGGVSNDDGTDGGGTTALGAQARLASGQGSLLGITTDGWAIFRDGDVLRAASLDGTEVEEVTARPGSVLLRGNVVFNWADVDWMKGVGDLSIWTAKGGTQEIGETPYAEALAQASADGSRIVYPANTTETTTDLMIASNDLESQAVLVPALGLGSETTCSAAIGFVGERLFVGWCEAESRVAQVRRFDFDGDGAWGSTLISDDALPNWSADNSGERVFFQSSNYAGYVFDDGEAHLLDSSVSQGTMAPDGTLVLYTVGDQLRRSAYPEMNPVPIVTTGYKQPIQFSRAFDLALYSTTVTYENGTQRDLRLVSTDGFKEQPIVLVEDPVAVLPRSSMTRDGKFVLYLSDVTKTGGTLHVVDRQGAEVLVLPNVVEAEAAGGSALVFTDNQSDPDQYPVVADLKIIDLGREQEPRLIEEKILDGHKFGVDGSGQNIVYTRSGVDRDVESEDHDGVLVQRLEPASE
jgi:hypothetical protein